MIDLLNNMNWWSGIVGGIAYFAIGSLWYGPLFGRLWMREKGMENHPEPPSLVMFLYSLLLQIICGISIAIFAESLSIETLSQGLSLGLACSLGFVATTVGINGIYNDMSFKLFFIDAGYHMIGFTVAGGIIGLW